MASNKLCYLMFSYLTCVFLYLGIPYRSWCGSAYITRNPRTHDPQSSTNHVAQIAKLQDIPLPHAIKWRWLKPGRVQLKVICRKRTGFAQMTAHFSIALRKYRCCCNWNAYWQNTITWHTQFLWHQSINISIELICFHIFVCCPMVAVKYGILEKWAGGGAWLN